MTSPTRLFAAAAASSLILGVLVFGAEWLRFGLTADGTAVRLEREVRETVAERTREVERLAGAVAANPALVADAAERADRVPALFEELDQLAEPADYQVAVTVYAATETPGVFRVLAWSDGPGEKNLSTTRLSGPPALFVAPGHAGLRLLRVAPVERNGVRIGVAVAETVLATVDRSSPTGERRLPSSYGPVTVIEQYASARDALAPASGFTIESAEGSPLLEVLVDRDQLSVESQQRRRRGLALAALPIPLAIGLLAGWPLARRSRARTRSGDWWRATAWASLAAACAAALLIALANLARLPADTPRALGALTAVGLVVLGLGHAWWRAAPRRRAGREPLRFVIEQLSAGVALAVGLEACARVVASAGASVNVGGPGSVLFPFSPSALVSLSATLLIELAIGWATASVLAWIAVGWRRSALTVAGMVALWLVPVALLLVSPNSAAAAVRSAVLVAVLVAVVFAIAAPAVRRAYRRATQSMRLAMLFAAMVMPLVALYPVSAVTADRLTRQLIAEEYAPATTNLPRDLRAELARAQADVDAMPRLEDLIGDGAESPENPSAFLVWSRTSLARTRVVSAVQLFNASGRLVSRFAFDLPESLNQTREGTGCAWEVFGEVNSFGAKARLMLHAERGICDGDGTIVGGVILHVAWNDYQVLPFVPSSSAYYDVLRGPAAAAAGPRVPELALAVYGWSPRPIFTTGAASWPVDQPTIDRLYRTGMPFWTSLAAGGRQMAVHFSQDRAGIYALGYPTATVVDHATRLTEVVALVAVLFVVIQLGALVHVAVPGRPQAPLRVVLTEVRTSFYRKLFLAFVAAAVGPVIVAALAFGGYMAARFEADVEREAATTVSVARSVFQELLAGTGRENGEATDDVMVWIRQVIGQDVNYFEGSELRATSQRDMFDSGWLPTRTPAPVYRGVALERRPTLVAEDRLGDFAYLVAAAPVPSRGAEAILTVPLASRQRELERELDSLSQRVLVGAVLVVVFAALLGAWLAGRVADPVARLTKATRQIAAGRLDVRIAADTADELRTLVDDFNSMAATLGEQRAALARTNQLKAWNDMARQVAHEIKNPLTPVQLAAEHLQQVHADAHRPLGAVLDQCVATILRQVRLLRQIASEFANFAGDPTSRPEAIAPAGLVERVVDPYRTGIAHRVRFDVHVPDDAPSIWADPTLVSRAVTNLVENAVQAMPSGGVLTISGSARADHFVLTFEDTGVGMSADALERAFEPYFSTKTAGSGLGLANAKRNIEREGGTVAITSTPGHGTTVTVTLRLAAPRGGGGDATAPSR